LHSLGRVAKIKLH